MKSNNLFRAINKKNLCYFVLVTVSVGFFYAYPITFTQKIVNELTDARNAKTILCFIVSYMICRIFGWVFDYLGAVLSKKISNGDLNDSIYVVVVLFLKVEFIISDLTLLYSGITYFLLK